MSVTPADATVVVTGPEDFSETFTGGRLLTELEPGQYTATGTATGYGEAASSINVMPGLTSSVSLHLLIDMLPPGAGGSLNINASPSAAAVNVSGPEGFAESFMGNQFLSDLDAGQYSVTVSSPGYGSASGEINVVLGQTSSITFVLKALPIISEAPRAVYRDGSGNLIPLGRDSLQSGPYVFFAWLEDEPGGISTEGMHTTDGGSPGRPTLSEQDESAPSFTQNLAAAWVGFTDANGVVRPVIGADVRWEIDQWWSERVGSMQFGTSDDNRSALGYGVFDDQADTRTNNARLHAQGFPLYASDYPLFNKTGVDTPHTDGFTWVTLFSPDVLAQGRIVAVATLNGEEIGKQILYKSFAPQPELQITKTVDNEIVDLVDGSATVTWTVTVTNVGMGEATDVELSDELSLGLASAYTAGSLPEGSTAVDDGFTISFPLGAEGADDDTIVLTFTGTVTEPGAYCNEARVVQFEDATQTWTPVDLEDDACFVALESNVSIIKDFVAADETTSLGRSRTVAADEPALLRVRVVNNGTGAASGVAVNDALTLGDGTEYEVLPGAPGTPNADNGFDVTIGDLAAGATETLLFEVAASADGRYCDTVTLTADPGTNIGTPRTPPASRWQRPSWRSRKRTFRSRFCPAPRTGRPSS